jgi:hypothetical protein
MGAVIGELLPLAIGVMLSPVPIIIVIVLLGVPRGKASAVAFVAGWLGALVGVGAVVLLLAEVADGAAGDASGALAGLAKLGIGLVLLGLAARQWRKRPAPGEPTELPGWMASLERVTPARSLGLGAVVAGVKPKNLVLTAAAALAIAEGELATGPSAALLLAYALLATAGVAAPLVAAVALGSRAGDVLAGWKAWLGDNNATIMALLLLLFGVILVGNGVAALA